MTTPPGRGGGGRAAVRGPRRGRVWFHRSFGRGSVSEEALAECERLGIRAIAGGCPLMYCGAVHPFHRCMRWWLGRRGRAPAEPGALPEGLA